MELEAVAGLIPSVEEVGTVVVAEDKLRHCSTRCSICNLGLQLGTLFPGPVYHRAAVTNYLKVIIRLLENELTRDHFEYIYGRLAA